MISRSDAKRAAGKYFGPKVELVRVSAREREERFKVCLGSYVINAGDKPTALLLGSGKGWSEAIDHARTTENGKMAEKIHLEALEFTKKALNSKNELEFATLVEEQAVREAIEAGASDAAIIAIRHKFTVAKEKINVAVNRAAEDNQSGPAEGPRDRHGNGPSGGSSQQVG